MFHSKSVPFDAIVAAMPWPFLHSGFTLATYAKAYDKFDIDFYLNDIRVKMELNLDLNVGVSFLAWSTVNSLLRLVLENLENIEASKFFRK